MAIARRLPENVEPIFVTLSLAMKVVKEAGYLCEYIPQAKGSHWTEFLEQRLVEIIHRYRPEGLLFDGTWPFNGLMQAQAATGLPFAWVRRPMWKEGMGEENLSHADRFELVIEPGEFAEAYDRGRTTQHREAVVGVDPILLLDDSELLEAAEAKAELGLSPSKRAVLVQLGSGNTWDVAERGTVTADRLLKVPDLDVVFVDWMISRQQIELPSGVKRLNTYPVSRYLRAFDFAVSAAGYNSFHELIGFGVPTIFVPTEKHLDDQHGRTRYAEDVGASLNLQAFSEHGLERCLELMLEDGRRQAMADRCRELFPGNGAQDAADAVADLFIRAPERAAV
jgi:hypothetical protein